MSSLQRVVSVLFNPTKTFQAIRERPTWVAPLLVLLLCSGAAGWVVVQRIDPDAQRQMIRHTLEDRGLSGRDLEQGVERGAAVYQRIQPFLPAIGLVFAVAAYLVVALIFWGMFNLVGGESTFLRAFSTNLHGLMPQALKALVTVPIVLGSGSVDPQAAQSGTFLASNLAVLAPEDAALWLKTLLSSVDFFTLWSVVLLVIGFSVTTKVKRGTSAAVVVGGWLLWVAVRTGWVAFAG